MGGEVAAELIDLVGAEWVATAAEELAWAAADATGRYRLGPAAALLRLPLAVVRPGCTEEVAAVVRWAGRRGVALVPRGAGTGVMGGAAVIRPSVVLDLSRLDAVHVHPVDMLAEAGAGAVLASVNARLEPHGLVLAHDPWSLGIATVGGAIGTDGVGYRAGRFGSMADQVVAVEAVLADGLVLRTRPYKPAAGPRLAGLFAGSQGTFGVVTRAWLQAVALPEAEGFAAFRFAGFDAAYAAVLALWRTGLRYDLLDLTDAPPEAQGLPPGLEGGDGRTAVLRLAALGPTEEVQARLAVARRVCLGHAAADLGPGPAREHWEERHAVAERYARCVHRPRDRRARDEAARARFDYLNLALPPSRVGAYRRAALERVAREPALRVGETGIWCRPEVFSLFLAESEDGGGEPDPERTHRVMTDLLHLALEHGGNAECIHGTGLKLLALLGEELGAGLGVLRRLKQALDPGELLNPGKWDPTLAGAARPAGDGP